MVKRNPEPDEALGPVIDGRDQLARLEHFLVQPKPEEIIEPEPEPDRIQTLLVCGNDEFALETARLAIACGFSLEVATTEGLEEGSPLGELATAVHVLDDYDNIIEKCNIDRDHYVCVFETDEGVCEHILYQCLDSDAAYLGARADAAGADIIFDALKEDGAPDAELAAVCCPMGLGIGAVTPAQHAVAVTAELMAAKSGALKRLRYSD